MNSIVGKKEQQFSSILSKLEALSPLKIMDRGYSIVYHQEHETIVKSVDNVKTGEAIKVQLQDGILDCQIEGIRRNNQSE
jgi:exodeoxyribonuclease VII large subunit